MRTRTTRAAAFLLAADAVLGWLSIPALAREKKPAATFTPAQLAERTLHRRAVEAVIWGIPAVNYDLMLQEAPRGRPRVVATGIPGYTRRHEDGDLASRRRVP